MGREYLVTRRRRIQEERNSQICLRSREVSMEKIFGDTEDGKCYIV